MLHSFTIKDTKLKIGEWCKLKRQGYELSQEELATTLDMSRVTIQKLEGGKNVTLDTLLKVANHFGGLETIYELIKQNIEDNNHNSLY
ncbi:MAG: helix-turn-helix transcriptional regulator [Bacteroidota bacterium]